MTAYITTTDATCALNYRTNQGGSATKNVRVTDAHAFQDAEGFTHISVDLEDQDRAHQRHLTVKALGMDGEIVQATVYGYSAQAGKAQRHGRRLGREATIVEA